MIWSRLCAPPLVFVIVACGGASAKPAAASSTANNAACDYYDYRFELADDLRNLSATVCFDGTPPRALTCGPQGDSSYAPTAERISAGLVEPLPTRGGHIDLEGLVSGDCVRYTIDLLALSSPHPLGFALGSPQLVTAQTGAFLFRPEVRGTHFHGHATFSLPEGAQVSLPWTRDSDGYLLDATAFELVGYAAFGSFETEVITRAGATLDVALLGDVSTDTRAAIVPWLRRVMDTTSHLGGAFPVERAQVALLPTPGAGGVRFGMVGRGGGPSIVFLFGRDSTETELIQSWEPAHEITHLRTPYVTRADRWLTEGIATYYQEVLRARGAVVTPEHAWQRLASGFVRGAEDGSGHTLRDESAQMYQLHRFHRVYWFGAALAFLADVELRAATHNQMTFDRALSELQACCARDARIWTADEMIARLDAFTGTNTLRVLADRYLDQTEFPDVASAFARLGVQVNASDVVLDATAEDARVRDAIMAPQVPLTAAE